MSAKTSLFLLPLNEAEVIVISQLITLTLVAFKEVDHSKNGMNELVIKEHLKNIQDKLKRR